MPRPVAARGEMPGLGWKLSTDPCTASAESQLLGLVETSLGRPETLAR